MLRTGTRSCVALVDAGARDWQNGQRAQPGKPMVGPIYIEGADRSAALKIANRWLPAAP